MSGEPATPAPAKVAPGDPRLELLTRWSKAASDVVACKPLIEAEQALRKEVFAAFFPSPVEGTNTVELPASYKLKAKYPIERKVDAAMVAVVRSMTVGELEPGMRQELNLLGAPDAMPLVQALLLNVDTLLDWEPKLKSRVYRELTKEQLAVVDRFITAKPGSVAIEIAAPRPAAAAPPAMGGGPESL